MNVRVLFLDDAGWRHSEFTRLTDKDPDVTVWQTHSAVEAISLLESQEFDQVFLDHDLSEEDQMTEVGAATKVPTGMTVVDHIVKMAKPPRNVIVHSHNGPAADEMIRRLRSVPACMIVQRIPFSQLVALMKAASASS